MTRRHPPTSTLSPVVAAAVISLLLGACAAQVEDDPVGATDEALIYSYDDVYEPPVLEPQEFLQAPLQVSISRRDAARVDFRFTDRTTLEYGYRIFRSVDNRPYELVRSYGALSGTQTYADTTVEPERLYCYFAQVYQGSTTESSPTRCARPPTTYFRRIMRAQLEITVADFPDAGTDDAVAARLNPNTLIHSPSMNETWLDYSHNDFEPGSVHTYDLVPPRRLSDITEVTIAKEGTDGLCLERVRLILNQHQTEPGDVVFDFDWGQGNCRWIDGDDGHQPTVTFNHAWLRAHPYWPQESTPWCGSLGECAATQFPMQMTELEARLEGMIGHALHRVGPISWSDDGGGPGSFSVVNGGTQRDLRIRGSLFGDGPIFLNAEADFDFLVRLRARSIEDETFISPSIENLDINIDFNAYSDALGMVILTPAGHLALSEYIEMYIEGRLEDRINPLAAMEVAAPNPFDGVCSILQVGGSSVGAFGASCDDLDGDGMNDEWERDNELDPDYGSDGVQDDDSDGVTNAAEYAAGTNPQCRWPDDHPNFCRDCGPCEIGEADCDSDAECRGGRTCSHDVGTAYGLPWYYDVCECPWPEGHANYCRDCGPCEIGQADCDSDAECAGSAICRHNVGAFYDLPSTYDVCECGLEPGHPDYCTECGPCESGVGDCDSDFDCEASASCVEDNGASFDLPENYDVCVCDSPLFCAVVTPPSYTTGY